MKIFKKKSVWVAMYAVYLSLILLSVQAFIAQNTVDEIRGNMDPSYDYYLTFREDGVTTHYDVMRHDSNEPGRIELTYYTDSNMLEISKVENIKTLEIDVQSLFEDESERVFKQANTAIPSMDMDYWLEAGDGIFTIKFDIAEGDQLESLTFTKFPTPTSVTVNNQEWWKTDTNFVITGSQITISDIPTGETTVVIDFNEEVLNQVPVPSFTITPEGTVGVNEEVSFDASASYDPDAGDKLTYLWDFGDTKDGSGKTTTHAFSAPDTYKVRLTVRDDFEPYAEAWIEKEITVQFGAEQDTDNDGLKDFWEWEHFGNLDQTPSADPDADGYENELEFLAKTDPADSSDFAVDSDSDSLDDLWEWQYFESLQYTSEEDPDGDGATNKEEFDAGTDPSDVNSKPKTEKPDDGEDKGMIGLGKAFGIDMLFIIVIVVVIIVIALFAVMMRSRKAKERKAADMAAAQQMQQLPVRGPPPAVPMEAAAQLPPEMGGGPLPAPAPAPAPAPMPAPAPAPVPMPEGPPEPEMLPEARAEPEPAVEEEVGAEEALLPPEPTRDEVIASFAQELDIGQFEAGVLYDSGYTSYEALEGAIVEEIAMIDEIGDDMAEKIMSNLQFVLAGGVAAAAAVDVAEGEAEAADEALAEEDVEAEAADDALAEEAAEEAPDQESSDEEAVTEEESESEEEAMECPVCGEPVEPGMANCPVCDTPL